MIETAEKQASRAWQNLNDRLNESRSVWQDETTHEFNAQYWDDIETEMPQLIASLQELDEVLREVDALLRNLES